MKEKWVSEKIEDGQGPYKGFLLVRCEKCGKVKAYCQKRETFVFKCECGNETLLEGMIPMHLNCKKCGSKFLYKTNIKNSTYIHTCIKCRSPVKMHVNRRGTAYVTFKKEGTGDEFRK